MRSKTDWHRAALPLHRFGPACVATSIAIAAGFCLAEGPQKVSKTGAAAEYETVGPNLIHIKGRWEAWGKGFQRDGDLIVCDNGDDTIVHRGAKQYVALNQLVPQPVVATAWSKAEGVTGKSNLDYSLYLDIGYADGTYLFGQIAPFSVGTHDWERRQVVVVPTKPIHAIDFYVLHRKHGGKVWFRDPELHLLKDLEREWQEKELAEQLAQLYKLNKDNRTVAVLDLVDKGPSVELAPLSRALAEMLTSDLAGIDGLRVVERVRVEGFLKEGHLAEGVMDASSAQQAGRTLAARYLLGGTFHGEGDRISVDVQLYEVGRDKPLAQWSLARPATEAFALADDLAQKTLASLGIDKPKRRPPPPPGSGPSPLVAVLALKNLSPSHRLDPMETGFAGILQANLSAIPNVRLVERQRLYEVLEEQKLSLSSLVDPTTAVRVGKLLGAQRLIYGSFVEAGEKLRLDVRLADTQTTWVLRSETAEGPTDDFAAQLEGLAVRLASSLAVQPPAEAADLVKAATPARKVETALHLARADLAFYRAQYGETARACERALLIEPKNVAALVLLTRSHWMQRDFGKAIESGQQALASGALRKGSEPKRQLCKALGSAYFQAMKFDEAAKIAEQMKAEFPQADQAEIEGLLFGAKFYAGQGTPTITKLELQADIEHRQGKHAAMVRTYAELLGFYVVQDELVMASLTYRQNRADPAFRKQVTEQSRQRAERIVRMFDVVLQEAPGHMDAWGPFVHEAVFSPIDVRYIAENGWHDRYLSDEERIAYLHRVVKVFPNDKTITDKAEEREAAILGIKRAPEKVLATLRTKLKNVRGPRSTNIPDAYDIWQYSPDRPLDELLWTRFRIAEAQAELPNEKKAVVDELKRLVSEFGLVNSTGVSVVQKLHEMGGDYELPKRAALIWGGGSRAQVVWRDRLAGRQCTVHGVAQYRTAGAHLAPYQLMVLVRQGQVAMAPSEIVALRGYVATGGSLLVVVSPGFEAAQPSLLNGLLSQFGVTVEGEMEVRAESTWIGKHPITNGIDKCMAKTAVNLKVPEGTEIVRAGDRVVLAAVPYRHGRVVIASFGQWLLPDPKTPPATAPIDPKHRANSLSRDKLPLEPVEGLELNLLDNVLTWLWEPHRDGQPLAAQRQPFVDAEATVLKARFGIVPRTEMIAALDRLIEQAPVGDWKEEALWAAGEATFGALYYPDGAHCTPGQTFQFRRGELFLPTPSYYRRLVDEFTDSPLRPYAQWRIGEARCHLVLCLQIPRSERPNIVKLFEQVDAPEGTCSWAWTKLRIGMLCYQIGDYKKAIESFLKTVNGMEAGPEKSMAMMNLGLTYQADDNRQEAIRYYRMAKSQPDIYFASTQVGPCDNWGPMNERGYYSTRAITQYAIYSLRKMWVFW